MSTRLWPATAFALVSLIACGREPPTDERSVKTPHRTDFAPEEFGIGRPHTRNARCNQEVDRLLDQIRVCYNTRPPGDCSAVQQVNSDRIARLKNERRCRR